MRLPGTPFPAISSRGFTLVEMIVVVFLLALAMVGILSVFDASARINKSESDVADAQGAVRYGIYAMTKAIRMAGSGGLFVTQAVLNHQDPQMPGIAVVNGVDAGSYDNVQSGTLVNGLDGDHPVRPGTDMIEIRGVINSPLIGFDLASGCEPCNPVSDPTGGCAPCVNTRAVDALATTFTPHVNDDATNRPQFSQIDDYTAGASTDNPMYVVVAFNDDVHSLCSTGGTPSYSLYPQPPYNVGAIVAPTRLSTATPATFGPVNFADPVAVQFNSVAGGTESPAEDAAPALTMKNVRNAGILDDLIFFIDNGTDPLHQHPSLAQGTRRGNGFDVVTLADDVEDMQVAYGVDLDGNTEINRRAGVAPTSTDPDTNVSSVPAGDEWVPNVPGADNPITTSAVPFQPTDFYDLPNHCPRLHAVMIALVAKSHDPDLTYKSPTALGIRVMNSPATIAPPYPDTAQYPGVPNPSYRRRVQTLKINLRNYSYQGLAPPAPPGP